MKQVFWLRREKIAGRSGPNRDPWDLAEIAAAGFSAILSVNGGDCVHETSITGLGMAYGLIPMSANAPAREGDREHCLANLPLAMELVERNLPNGPVLIHCRSGKDRTGLVMAACLVEFEGLPPATAMNAVLEVRPIAFSAEGWMDFSLDVLRHFDASRRARPR